MQNILTSFKEERVLVRPLLHPYSISAMCSDPMMRMMMPGCAGGDGSGGGYTEQQTKSKCDSTNIFERDGIGAHVYMCYNKNQIKGKIPYPASDR